jgi:L-asparaginase/Glu-tRNA(Gln) amidotransferase subunit D
MTNEERELDLLVGNLLMEVKRLRQIEQTASLVVNVFSNTMDYHIWDQAIDALEAALKEKP